MVTKQERFRENKILEIQKEEIEAELGKDWLSKNWLEIIKGLLCKRGFTHIFIIDPVGESTTAFSFGQAEYFSAITEKEDSNRYERNSYMIYRGNRGFIRVMKQWLDSEEVVINKQAAYSKLMVEICEHSIPEEVHNNFRDYSWNKDGKLDSSVLSIWKKTENRLIKESGIPVIELMYPIISYFPVTIEENWQLLYKAFKIYLKRYSKPLERELEGEERIKRIVKTALAYIKEWKKALATTDTALMEKHLSDYLHGQHPLKEGEKKEIAFDFLQLVKGEIYA